MCFPGQRDNVERVAALLAEPPTLTSPQVSAMTGIPVRTVIRHRKKLGLNVPRGGASHGDAPVRKPVRKPRTPKVIGGWNIQDEQALLARAREGVFAAALSEEFQCHLSTVHRICAASGVTLARAPHGPKVGTNKRSLETREKIRVLLEDDPKMSTRDLMEAVGLGLTAVQKHRAALGLNIPKGVTKPKAVGPKVQGRHFECQTCSREFPLDAHPVYCENGARCVIRLTR